MIDLTPVLRGKQSIEEALEGVGVAQLRQEVDVLTDKIFDYISESSDDDVVFVPSDRDAHDPYAVSDEEINMPWTLGHIIVHLTASSEESAMLAAEMARGVWRDGRSRYEIPWQTITTIQQCKDRLEESRRMLLASLDMWPDPPHLEIKKRSRPTAPELNAIGRFLYGLHHAKSHLKQIQDVVRQAKTARLKEKEA